MRTSQIEHEYDSTVSDFGRRVANRWLYATTKKAGKVNFALADFYAMYGSEDRLPESERTRSADDAKLLDVTGFSDFYQIDREQHFINAALKIHGTTRDWTAELNAATGAQRAYLGDIVLGLVTLDDASEEWQEYAESTNNVDAFVLFVLFAGRWPRSEGNRLLPNEAKVANELSGQARVLTDQGEK
ncbi:hypothetical protein EVC45_02450 [Paraburkholderia sp. UYCP14C]|uniref:hypothetical protein n=1 Tax=Paraburkholderia sp. UYCP14C TaxID=2511130 RepID=UPI00102012FF|nr:hypothetical protein [Paraburkholderia sp. UYCP14C]RZF31333.1 hypothetical protein EVC45_02450 [Paraburkholderia sp. UYCP14C]